jgi:hypothetical protein
MKPEPQVFFLGLGSLRMYDSRAFRRCPRSVDNAYVHVLHSILAFQAMTGSFSSRVDQNCSEG